MKNIKIILVASFFIMGLFYGEVLKAQHKYFKKWPNGTSPKEIGEVITKRFIETPHTNFGFPTPPGDITYPETCTWYGALLFTKAGKNKELNQQLIERFAPLFTSEKHLQPKADHVDHSVFGAIPLELYLQTGEQKYLDLGLPYADLQWEMPRKTKHREAYQKLLNRGLTWQTRMWVDDMFMITTLQAQAFRATDDEKYINRAAKEMVVYLDELQRPNGLFYHAPDVPFFWGRGNGWMAAGMTGLLSILPKDNPDRPRILEGYKTMMSSLKDFQGDNGMWRQLVDDPESWPETSSTGMFTYAMITGVKEGWLDKKVYGPVARKAWLALITYIDANGDVREVCQGTNKKNDRQYYLDRKRIVGDMHGQAPVLWCAYALLQ